MANDLTREQALARFRGGTVAAPRQLSREEALTRFRTAPAPTPEQEPTGLLRAAAGSALESLATVPEAMMIATKRAPGLAEVEQAAARGTKRRPVAPQPEPPLAGLLGGVSSGLRGAAEQIDPAANRGRGGLLEDLARAGGSIAGAAPAMAMGPAAAAVQFAAQEGVPLYYEIKAATGDEEAALWGLLGGGLLGQLEQFGVEGLLSDSVRRWAGGAAGKELAKRMTARALGAVGAGAAEAGTELAQQAGSDALYEALTGEDVDIIENLKRTLPPALILGTGIGTLVEAVDAGRARKAAGVAPTATEAIPHGAQPEPVRAPTGPVEAELIGLRPPEQAPAVQEAAGSASQSLSAEPVKPPAAAETLPEAQRPVSVEEETGGPDLPTPKKEAAPTEPSKTTGIKNAAVEKELEGMGLPLPEKQDRKGFVELHARAKQKMEESDGKAGRKLVDELEENPRLVSDEDAALLTFEANRLVNERDAAEKDYIETPSKANQERIDQARAAYERAANVFDRVGTESGRALNARKMMLARDFSLAAIERKLRIAKGEDLSPAELSEAKKLHEDVASATGAREKYVTEGELKRAVADAETAMRKLLSEAKSGKRRTKRAADIEQAKKDLGDALDELGSSMRLGSTGGGINFKALAKAASAVIRIGGKTFAQWADDMVARFGETIRPHLRGAWDAAHGERRREMAEGLKGKTPEEMHPAVSKIALDIIEHSGTKDRVELEKAVHEVLKDVEPNISIEEARDALSGRGRFKQLSKDEARKTLRDLQGQMRQVSKAEELEGKIKPKKTGFERQEPSPTQKRLAKRVKELKGYLGLKPVDPAKAEAAALTSLKSRMQGQINALEYQVESGRMETQKGGKPKLDAEAQRLSGELATMKKEFADVFSGELKAQSDAQRIAAATKAVERSLADLERRVAAKDISRVKAAKGPTSAKLEALRAERDARRAELEWLRLVSKPKKSPDAIALAAYKTRKQNQIAKLHQRLTFQDFAPDVKRPPVTLDKEAIRLTAEETSAKRRVAAAAEKQKLAARGRLKIGLDGAAEVLDLYRSFKGAFDFSAVSKQGGFFTRGHPFKSAAHAKEMIKAWGDVRVAAEVDAQVRERAANIIGGDKLELTSADGTIGPAEEALRSRLSDRLPLGVGAAIKASNRAYITYLNLQRITHYEAMIDGLGHTPTKEEAHAIADFVNIATGRAAGKGKTFASRLSGIKLFWAPSYTVSRFQLAGTALRLLVPGGKGMTRAVRKAIGKEFGRYVVGQTAYYGLLAGFGAAVAEALGEDFEIGHDWRSSDFGKTRIGNVRVDPLSGMAQVATLLGRMVTGETVNAEGDVEELGSGLKSRGGALLRYGRSKLGPIQGMLADALFQETYTGKKITPAEALLQPPVPLAFVDAFKAMDELGIPTGTALTLLGLLGDSIQVYEPKNER